MPPSDASKGTSPSLSVSVVVCTSNRPARTLQTCFESLCYQDIAEAIEIVIVDGNSDDRVTAALPSALRERTIPVTHLTTGQPTSLISARHRGIEASSGEYVAFIDDDCVATESWLRNMITYAREKQLDALQGRIVGFAELTFMERFARFDKSQMAPSRWPDGTIYNICNANALYRLQLLRELDFHLERTRALEAHDICIGHEDYLMTQEALKHEAALGYCENAIVAHRHPSTFRAKTQQFRNYGWNAFGYCWITCTDPAELPGYAIPSRPTKMLCLRSWLSHSPRLLSKFIAAAEGPWTLLETCAFPLVCSALELSYLLGAYSCAQVIAKAASDS